MASQGLKSTDSDEVLLASALMGQEACTEFGQLAAPAQDIEHIPTNCHCLRNLEPSVLSCAILQETYSSRGEGQGREENKRMKFF